MTRRPTQEIDTQNRPWTVEKHTQNGRYQEIHNGRTVSARFRHVSGTFRRADRSVGGIFYPDTDAAGRIGHLGRLDDLGGRGPGQQVGPDGR